MVRAFPGLPRVEGLAPTTDGRWVYVSDEEDAVWTHIEVTS
jgi:hypothetical protein